MPEIKDKWPWPANMRTLGTHPEEVKALRKGIEKNPDASPVPELAPSELLEPTRNSERLRMGGPQVPTELAEATTRTLMHVVFRRVLRKARRRGVVLFDDAVEEEDLADLPQGRREQMITMIARERALLELLDHYNSLAEDVYMRLLSGAKG